MWTIESFATYFSSIITNLYILGIWIGENESAKFWLTVLNEIKIRGVKDIFDTKFSKVYLLQRLEEYLYVKVWKNRIWAVIKKWTTCYRNWDQVLGGDLLRLKVESSSMKIE